MSNKYSVGIDLGTTYSCVAVWNNGKVEIIANTDGNRTTPSYVAFTENEFLVGDSAKNQCTSNPLNTIYDTKRLIGRDFLDETVQTDIKKFQYKTIGVNGKPYVEVQYMNETKQYSPEQIASMILSKMKQIASAFLGTDITDVVITVPAYFNDNQKQATKDAGRIAGLNVLRIINEPTAAALAYGLDKNTNKESNVLIFDFGGGTHDVTLLTLESGLFQVKATAGDTRLGGEDLDNRLVDYCVNDFLRKHKLDLSGSPKALRRLRTHCEKAKRILSTNTQTTIEVDALFEGIDYSINISRAKFEELNMDYFKKTIEPVKKVLEDAKLDKSQVDEIVLVGGSTRIPKIRQMLSDFFGGKKLNESVNPDEAVAYGAAVQAAILGGITDEKLDKVILVDVAPLSLGIETVGGLMSNIIDRNTTIPCKRSQVYSTNSDNQTNVTIQIFEGERKFTKDNNCLGTFNLDGITPAPRGVPQIEVTFNVDANGILNVIATDKMGTKTKNLVISNNKGRFTDQQIQNLINEAKEFEAADLKKKEAIDARNELENYTHTVKMASTETKILPFINSETRSLLDNLFSEIANFIDENPHASKEIYIEKKKALEEIWNPIAVKMYNTNNPSETQS